MKYPTLSAALILPLTLSTVFSGCVKSQPSNREPVFEVEVLDACLAIVVDMSGSYREYWNTRAYRVFVELMNRFFTDEMGGDTRVVIGQLSGEEQVVLFEGRPRDLQARFSSAEELGAFLKKESKPQSSRVYHATAEIADYMSSHPGVGEETRLLTVILSDGVDTNRGAFIREQELADMNEALERYQERGGALALYFVAQAQTSFWKRTLQDAGFEPGTYVVEGELVESPQLPSFQ